MSIDDIKLKLFVHDIYNLFDMYKVT